MLDTRCWILDTGYWILDKGGIGLVIENWKYGNWLVSWSLIFIK